MQLGQVTTRAYRVSSQAPRDSQYVVLNPQQSRFYPHLAHQSVRGCFWYDVVEFGSRDEFHHHDQSQDQVYLNARAQLSQLCISLVPHD